MSPVEAFVTGIEIFDQQKVCLIGWLSLLKLLIAWFLMSQRSNYSRIFWSLGFCSSGYLDPLISSQKSLWFNFDLSHKHGTYKWLHLVHVTMMVCRCLLGIPRLRLKTKWVKLAVCGHQNNDQRVVSGQLTDCSGYEKSLWLRSKWPTSSNLGIQSLGSSVSPLYAKLTWPDILHSAGAQDQVPIFSYEAQ